MVWRQRQAGMYVYVYSASWARASVQLFVRACVRRSSIVQCPGPRAGAVGRGKTVEGVAWIESMRKAQRLRGFAQGVGGGVRREAGIVWASVGSGSAGFRGVMRYGWRDAGNSLRTCS